MSALATNNNNEVAAKALPANPLSGFGLPDALAIEIFRYMTIGEVRTFLDTAKSEMRCDRYATYLSVLGMRSSLTGTELVKFQRLLSLEGKTLIAGAATLISWANLLEKNPIVFSELKHLDLSDNTNIPEADVIALSKSCPNLTTLILPGAFPSDQVMAVLRTNCPHAAIYPSAMTEQEWTHPAEFMAKLPPPPQAIEDFINSPRPNWEGKTSAEVHMVVPRVNKIVRNIDGGTQIVPWTLYKVSELDKATGGVGCRQVWDDVYQSSVDKPSEIGFEWIVFTKDVLPQSRNKTYTDQKRLAEHWGYEVPGFLDATTCMLWENRISGNRINNDNPWTYTRCKETVRDWQCINWQLIAGGFAPNGVRVDNYLKHYDVFDGDSIGVGGLKKFKV